MSYDTWVRITLKCDEPECDREYQGMGGCSVEETRKQAKRGVWTYKKGDPATAKGKDFCGLHGKGES